MQVQKVFSLSQQSDLCQVLEGLSWNLRFDRSKVQVWGNARCLDMMWDFTGPGSRIRQNLDMGCGTGKI